MVVRCPTYFQAVKWARMECRSYKIPEPDRPDDEETDDLPLFLRSDFLRWTKTDLCLRQSSPRVGYPGRGNVRTFIRLGP